MAQSGAQPKNTKLFEGLRPFDIVALFAYAASSPVLLPVLDAWRTVFVNRGRSVDLMFTTVAPLMRMMAIVAMVTALAFLFICLLKPTFVHLGKRLVALGCAAEVAGPALLIAWYQMGTPSVAFQSFAGAALGFGAAVMFLVFFTRMRAQGYRCALAECWLLALAAAGSSLAVIAIAHLRGELSLLAPSILGTLSLVAAVGGMRLYLRTEHAVEQESLGMRVNWWDAFAAPESTFVEDDEAQVMGSRASWRALFFVVVPLVMLMLLVTAQVIVLPYPFEDLSLTLGTLIGVVIALPLLRITEDRLLFGFICSMFMPAFAFAIFAAGVFFGSAWQSTIISLASIGFCTVFGLAAIALAVRATTSLRALALPFAAMAVVTVCVVAMAVHAPDHGMLSGQARIQILSVLLAASAVLLMMIPATRIWRSIMGGIDQARDAAQEKAPSEAEQYARRCADIASAHGLTARESEILVPLGRGYTSAYIAQELVLSESTVRTHRKNIYRKLGISSRSDLLSMIYGDEQVK